MKCPTKIKRLVKMFVKMFIPSSAKLSGYAADKIATSVNECGKTDTIAEYSKTLKRIIDNANAINEMLIDGRIDESERDSIAATIEPLISNVIELI